jgi:hypothetical protein
MIFNGTLAVDGRISANGQSTTINNNGGGAGGSIWLTVGTLSGAGTISANGGAGHLPFGGGGGGGRLAVFFTGNSFTGTLSAKGGAGYGNGGAGTIYLKASASQAPPTLIVDNGGLPGTNTTLDLTSFQDLRVLGGAYLTTSIPWLSISSNLIVGTNSTLAGGPFMTLTVGNFPGGPAPFGTAIIAGRISVDGTSISSSGLGGSSPSGSGGGAYGGYGGAGAGAPGGAAFGTTTSPSLGGGRGGNYVPAFANGGGALRITVNGGFGPLILNGRLSAGGAGGTTNIYGGSGGGAGGSIWLTLGTLSGSGTIAADGGAGYLPSNGGGGGGRIAVFYSSNAFAGTFSAKGGLGYANGGAGTIYLKKNESSLGRLIVDNGGLAGTNTLLDTGVPSLSDLTINGGGSVTSQLSAVTVSNLSLTGNSSLLPGPSATLTVTAGANIGAGCAISLDGSGVQGTGIGSSSSLGSGGGGHAGYGGSGAGAGGGTTSDSASAPANQGGRGGSISQTGPPGGGALRMNVTGPLRVDGRISANGLNTFSNNNGGGAGGSLWLTVGGLSGSGVLSANGGAGHLPAGGGGGGGRIALYYSSNSFSGSMSAVGGAGFVKGGAGTLYYKANTNSVASLALDNGGTKGTNTAVSVQIPGYFELDVQGGGVAAALPSPLGPAALLDLMVHSNGWVSQTGDINVYRNATIEAGGGYVVDGLGSDPLGAGLSSTTQAGGGGHGGYGGSHSNVSGLAYDSVTSPTHSGGVGGNGSGSSVAPLGGAGGGTLHLSVVNTLRVDGLFSAAGMPGDVNSGGGAGGSVLLGVGTLSGSGTISAQGGSGNGSGGGGAGGRVAIYFDTNSFTGNLSACGGPGFEAGGAGTVYLKTNSQPFGQLFVNNCAISGASTPFSQSFGLAPTIQVGSGATAELQSPIPILSNVLVSAGGTLTGVATDTNLSLAILGDCTVQSGGMLQVDAKGYAQGAGPGAGNTLDNKGSGGGYGGMGGASSSGAQGGSTYHSDTQPVARGSGGGAGLAPAIGGSQGGGAVRLTVSGQLTLDGLLSANGGVGLQDDSGGGSGGSIWVTAASLAGGGNVAANGGNGELYGGGGGGGGRIALYSPVNTFTGQVSVAGGNGAFPGEAGSVYTSSIPPSLTVISQNPAGVVSSTVSQVTLLFNAPVNPATADPSNIVLYTPAGPLPGASLTVSEADPSTLYVNFPAQNVPGDYRIAVGPGIEDFLGQPMSQVYSGSFTLNLPVISGVVVDTNGQPVTGVLLQQAGSGLSTTTDAHGTYSLGVDWGWSGTVVPSLNSLAFVPGSRIYTNLNISIADQDYLAVTGLAPTLTTSLKGTNMAITWFGIPGVTYQALYSTNLLDWLSYGGPLVGTNGPAQLLLPVGPDPRKFFRLQASN